MKIIVKDNKVIAIHNDEQSVKSLYPGSDIVLAPNVFKYSTPIIDLNTKDVEYNRYNIKVGDPNPMTNITNVSLQNCQIIAGTSISEDVNQYIQYKPITDEVRYTQAKQSSFTDILMYCKQWLEDNPEATTEEKEPYETRITLINNARAWIRTVLSYYYDKVAEIRAATTGTIINITWDFDQFEESDPDVWLETVYI